MRATPLRMDVKEICIRHDVIGVKSCWEVLGVQVESSIEWDGMEWERCKLCENKDINSVDRLELTLFVNHARLDVDFR
jgi:hypothetical protein